MAPESSRERLGIWQVLTVGGFVEYNEEFWVIKSVNCRQGSNLRGYILKFCDSKWKRDCWSGQWQELHAVRYLDISIKWIDCNNTYYDIPLPFTSLAFRQNM